MLPGKNYGTTRRAPGVPLLTLRGIHHIVIYGRFKAPLLCVRITWSRSQVTWIPRWCRPASGLR